MRGLRGGAAAPGVPVLLRLPFRPQDRSVRGSSGVADTSDGSPTSILVYRINPPAPHLTDHARLPNC